MSHSIEDAFECDVCGTFIQGFVYYCKQCDFYVDVGCISLPRILKQKAHAHSLCFTKALDNDCCGGCGNPDILMHYSCDACNFHLCFPCIKLPLTARHRYDNHHLKLRYWSVENELGEYYCDICEGKRDPKHWFYSCKDCDLECHPHCLLGKYPQVKLGTPYKSDAHPHLLTLVEKRKSHIPFDKRDNILPCEACGKPCEGLVFECRECNINMYRKRKGECYDP